MPVRLAVHAFDSAYGHAFLHYDFGIERVGQAECLHAGVIAAVESSVDYRTDAEARAEGVAQQVGVFLFATHRGYPGVYFGEQSLHSLAKCEEVAVVVDVDGYAEAAAKYLAESHPVAERREVGQVAADDAVGIVGRTGKCKTDGHGQLLERCDDFLETGNQSPDAEIEVVGVG